MTRLGHLEVKVKVEDIYAVEYEDDDDEAEESESVATKYIEAVSGASFGITCRVLPTYHFNEDFLSFQIFVDGERAGGMHFFSTAHDHRRGQAILLHHASVGWNNDRKRLRYRFADLRTRKSKRCYIFLPRSFFFGWRAVVLYGARSSSLLQPRTFPIAHVLQEKHFQMSRSKICAQSIRA
jgi:hypothetical protein